MYAAPSLEGSGGITVVPLQVWAPIIHGPGRLNLNLILVTRLYCTGPPAGFLQLARSAPGALQPPG